MIKNTLILFLLAFYTLTSCRVALPLMEYALNYRYIVAELCVNKAKPELNCCGKCHVKKQIAAANDTENSSNPRQSSKDRQFLELFHLCSIIDDEPSVTNNTVITLFSRNAPPLCLGYVTNPSKPPEV